MHFLGMYMLSRSIQTELTQRTFGLLSACFVCIRIVYTQDFLHGIAVFPAA